MDEKLGDRYRKLSSLEDDPVIPRAAYVSPEAIGDAEGGLIGILFYVGAVATAGAIVASGGTLTAAILGAVLSGGVLGVIGAFLARLLGEEHGRQLQAHVDRGGLLLWVRTWDATDEKRAMDILRKHSAGDREERRGRHTTDAKFRRNRCEEDTETLDDAEDNEATEQGRRDRQPCARRLGGFTSPFVPNDMRQYRPAPARCFVAGRAIRKRQGQRARHAADGESRFPRTTGVFSSTPRCASWDAARAGSAVRTPGRPGRSRS